MRLDRFGEIGQHALGGVLEAFPSRRANIVTATPDLDLIFPILFRRFRLVEALQFSVHPFVQRLVPFRRNRGLSNDLERQSKRLVRPLQYGSESAIEPVGTKFL